MNQRKQKISLEPIEKKVMDKANFLYICKYNGSEHLRTCIREALLEITKFNEVQVCKLFDVYSKDIETIKFDFELYIEELYSKMILLGAE